MAHALPLTVQITASEMEEAMLGIATQTFNTLTEFCQGPCPENQITLVSCSVTLDINLVLRLAMPHGCVTRAGACGDLPSHTLR